MEPTSTNLMIQEPPKADPKATLMTLFDFVQHAPRFHGSVPLTFELGPNTTEREIHEAFQKAVKEETYGEVDETNTQFTLRWETEGVAKSATVKVLPPQGGMEALTAPKLDMQVFTFQRARHEEANLMLEEVERRKNWKPWHQPGQRMNRHNDRHHFRASKGRRR